MGHSAARFPFPAAWEGDSVFALRSGPVCALTGVHGRLRLPSRWRLDGGGCKEVAVQEALRGLVAELDAGQPAALATVVQVQAGSPAQVGFKMLVRADGTVVGNLGGGALEARARMEAQVALHDGESRLSHYSLREEGPDAVGMLCGGEVTVFIEVCQPLPALLVVGGGHVGQPLAEMASTVGFHVRVVDVKPERASEASFDLATITPRTYVVLITENHVTDEQWLRRILGTPAAYIGMIGSQRKVRVIFEHLRSDGVTAEQLARVHAPIGLDLGGHSPAEIALAILAEVVQVRYGGGGRSRALLGSVAGASP